MIKNERQLSITKVRLEDLRKQLEAARSQAPPPGMPPEIAELHFNSAEESILNLQKEITRYEELKAGKVGKFTAGSLIDLPRILIEARIARGFSHKELANRLHVKEQQVQRWEASDYAGITLESLKKITEVLDIVIQDEIFLPTEPVKDTAKSFTRKIAALGISQDLLSRLLPSRLVCAIKFPEEASFPQLFQAAALVGKIFSLPLPDLLNSKVFLKPLSAPAGFQFKTSRTAKLSAAYLFYVRYLCTCVAHATPIPENSTLGSDWHEVYKNLTADGQPITFQKALLYTWAQGIIILPLRAPGEFHGAVLKQGNRFVIVLKQTTEFAARWLYDLLHEFGHIAKGHRESVDAILESEPIGQAKTEDPKESEADEWAENTLFDGEADLVAQACVKAANSRTERLKAAIPQVAEDYNLDVGVLANYMAYRLATQGQNWWGSAANLNTSSKDSPFEIARRELLLRLNFDRLSAPDQEILISALSN